LNFEEVVALACPLVPPLFGHKQIKNSNLKSFERKIIPILIPFVGEYDFEIL
jgi:hypothetical protein